MRIYTEVNFKWDDKKDKLVEVSSKSFDYNSEIALAKRAKKEWTDGPIKYDAAGNKWHARFYVNTYGRVTEQEIYKNDSHVHNIAKGGGARAAANTKFEEYVKGHTASYTDPTLYDSDQAWKDAFELNYGVAPTEFLDSNLAILNKYEESDGAYSLKAGETLEDVDLDLTEEQELAKRSVDALMLEKAKEWAEIVNIEQSDIYQDIIEEYVETLGESEEDMFTAFERMDEAIGEAKTTYQQSVERLTGEEGTYTRDIAQLELDKTEGLGETVLTREEELESIREEGLIGIRAAEAKVGAAGFATSGVGRTARDVLAEEIGKEARDVDAGFTRERGKISAGHVTSLEELRIGKEKALQDYKDIRDDAASDVTWQDKTRDYERLFKDLPDVIDLQTKEATARMKVLGGEMEQLISQARTPEEGFEATELIGYDPFAAGGVLSGEEYAFLKPGFTEIGGITGMEFTPGFAEGLFGADQYGAYTPGEDYIPYQPEFLTELGDEEEEESDLLTLPTTLTVGDEYLTPPVFKKSDISIKKDITRISKLKNGIPVYLFRYKWSDKMSIGVMAQDVEKILPEAVIKVDGIKAVNYNLLNKKV